MKHFFLSLAVILLVVPTATHATVASSDEQQRLTSDTAAQNTECLQIDSAFSNSGALPLWKTLKTTTGLSLRYPWSEGWMMLGKPVTPFDARTQNGVARYQLGRFQNLTDACRPEREYEVSILQGMTIKQYLAPAPEKDDGSILEQMTINGKKVAIIDSTSVRCSAERLAVEITKNKKKSVVLISHGCGSVNSEMIRMAGSIK